MVSEKRTICDEIDTDRMGLDSGICLDLLREDKKLYDDLDHMRQRLLSLIETQQGQLQLSQILAGQGLSAA